MSISRAPYSAWMREDTLFQSTSGICTDSCPPGLFTGMWMLSEKSDCSQAQDEWCPDYGYLEQPQTSQSDRRWPVRKRRERARGYIKHIFGIDKKVFRGWAPKEEAAAPFRDLVEAVLVKLSSNIREEKKDAENDARAHLPSYQRDSCSAPIGSLQS